jgi:hypothetical protein
MAFGQPGNPIFGLTGSTTFDVDMRPIALMDLETSGSSSNLTITLSAPDEAGDPIGTNPLFTNSENWINYSCSNRDVSSRHIEVEISSGSVPDGFELRLDVATATGGGGTLGSPALGTIVLSSISQSIVTGIEGAFTGDSFGNGHQLTFSLHFLTGSYGSINNQNSGPIIISYTLVDD